MGSTINAIDSMPLPYRYLNARTKCDIAEYTLHTEECMVSGTLTGSCLCCKGFTRADTGTG